MSAKNIVNPDHYKIAGRGRRNEQIVPEVEKQRMARETQQAQERFARRRKPAMDSAAGAATADAAQSGPREDAGTRGALAARGSRKPAAPASAAGKRAGARTSRPAAARAGQRARKGTAQKGTARKASGRKASARKGAGAASARKRAGASTSRQRQGRR